MVYVVTLLLLGILYFNDKQKTKANQILQLALENLRNTQEQLIEQKERAELGEQSKQRFLAHISHEIRTPLHGIAGFTDLLLETSLSEKQRRWLFAIHQSTERLGEVVNDVLELSKLEAGQLKLRHIPFSPSSVAKDVHESLAIKAQHKGIGLVLDIADNVPGAVFGDPTRLYQILMNLTGNAVKFTEKGAVKIVMDGDLASADPQEVQLRIRVIDTGIGIPAEKISAVFGSFQQAGEDTVARFGGTGLGLTVTQELVQLHGGEIEVKSTLAVGTTFSVVLPFHLASASDLAPKNEETLELFFDEALDILLVDDNVLNREIASEAILRHFENAKIVEAVNGKEALTALEQQNFDLVLMDMQMPTMSGTEATRHIRGSTQAAYQNLPIIALTASTTQEDIEKALESGMDKHLSKPFKPHQLAEVVAEALGLTDGKEQAAAQAHPNESTNGRLIDLSFLRDFTNGDEAQMRHFIQKFLQQYPLELQQLEAALHQGNFQEMYLVAHSFKPQLEFVGLEKAASLVRNLEEGAKLGAPSEQLSNLLIQISDQMKALQTPEQWFTE